jgi:hypothetical protein
MKIRSLAIVGAILLSAGISTPSFAYSGDHPILRKIYIAIYKHRHSGGGTPAPLLAAGIPAFLALGGGAVTTKFVRRFRRSNVTPSV